MERSPKGGNLPRNLIIRGGKVPETPMSYIDINREKGLWEWLASLEQRGILGIAIPHNSNASKGMMFPDIDSNGELIDQE